MNYLLCLTREWNGWDNQYIRMLAEDDSMWANDDLLGPELGPETIWEVN